MALSRRQALQSVIGVAAAASLPLAERVRAAGPPAARVRPAPGQQSDANNGEQSAVRKTDIGTAGVAAEPVCLTDFEPLAQARVSPMVWEYVNSAAADEITLKWNREALNRIRLKPRVLVDVSKLDTRVTLFGQEMSFPIICAPTGSLRAVHPEGEIGAAHGAAAAATTFVVSTGANTTLEEIAAASKTPLWFQLYVQPDRGFTRQLVLRAQAAGYRALCVTVDSPVNGPRNRQQRAKFVLPPGLEFANLRGLIPSGNAGHFDRRNEGQMYSSLLSADLTWKDVAWLQSFAKIPVLLKGVLNADDAERAVKEGVSGVIVSNHGARNFDTVPATAEALPLVADKVAGRIPVLMDGGIRRGTDVLKALAMGASAVQIGRPYLYGLAVSGAAGVTRVLQILQNEFQMAMALAGRATIASIDRTVLWPAAS
jgi:4-hydroxymandelate oxidase